MFCNSMLVDVYNRIATHGRIRVEQDKVHQMIDNALGVQGGMKPE